MKRVPTVVISTDGSLIADLKRCGEQADLMDLVLEFGIPHRELTEVEMNKIRLASPRIIFLDLEDDPETGCRVARYLSASLTACQIVAVGVELPTHMLVEAMRAGVSEYLEKPLLQSAFDQALDRLSQKLPVGPRESAAERHVLMFCGAKGGAGSTTVATNLAIQLHRQTRGRVLIVDLDLMLGDVALYLGIEPRYGIADLARNLHRLDEGLLGSYITSHESGVEVLSAPFDPDEGRGIGAEEVSKILKFLRGVYDWIVIDASSTLDSAMLAGLRMADEMFFITQVDVPSLRNIQRVRRVLKRAMPERTPRIVINRFHPGADITLKDVERTLGLEVFGTLPNDYGSIAQSINAGEPLVMSADSIFEQEMCGMVGKITGVSVQPERKARWQLRFRSRSPRKRAPESPLQAVVLAEVEL